MIELLKDNQYGKFVVETLKTARKSIKISTFKAEFPKKGRAHYLENLFKVIFLKAQQGVEVKLLINWHENKRCVPKTNIKVMLEFQKQNIKVKYLHHNRCCHSKIIIIDNKIVFLGSHNLSTKSFTSNFETSLILSTEEINYLIVKTYDELWEKAKAFFS